MVRRETREASMHLSDLANYIIALVLAAHILHLSRRFVFRRHWGRFNAKRAYLVFVYIFIVIGWLAGVGLTLASQLYFFFSLFGFGIGAIIRRSSLLTPS